MFNLLKAAMLVSLFAISSVIAQWPQRYGGSGIDSAKAITVDVNNKIYITGIRYDPNYSVYMCGTIMYPSTGGSPVWTDLYYVSGNTTGRSIENKQLEGGILIAVTGDGINSSNHNSCFTIGYSSNGGKRWSKTFNEGNNSNHDSFGRQLGLDGSGNTYVCGYCYNGSNYVYFLISYSPTDGSINWGPVYYNGHNGDNFAFGISVSQNIYVTGISQQNNEGEDGHYDIVTLAYETDGSFIWESEHLFYGTSNAFDVNKPIKADYATGVYVTGSSDGYFLTMKYDKSDGSIAWFDTTRGLGQGRSIVLFPKSISKTWPHTNDVIATGTKNNNSNYDFNTIMYSDDGTEVWNANYPVGSRISEAYDICVDESENSYVTGYVYNPSSLEPSDDYATVKYNVSGAGQELSVIDGGYNSTDISTCIAIDNSDNVDISGYSYSSSSNFDYLTTQYSVGDNLIFIHNQNSDIPRHYSLEQNYPNPFNPITTIRYQLPKAEKVTIKIFDILGRLVKTLVDENKNAGYYQVKFDCTNFASGVYFYRIVAGEFTNMKKMVILK